MQGYQSDGDDHPDIQFTFLGYTFRPRKAVDKYGRVYVNFSPAVSRDALKAMRQTIRGWHLQLKSDKSLATSRTCSARSFGAGSNTTADSMPRRSSRVAARERVLDPMAEAQAQEAGGPQNAGRRDAEAPGATSARCIRALEAGISVVGWMMGAG